MARYNIKSCVIRTRSISDLSGLITIAPIAAAATSSSASKELLREYGGHQGKKCKGLHVCGRSQQQGRLSVQRMWFNTVR